MGLPAATEFLDPIVPQYIADLVSWAAIGARTTESQTHREMASGLSMPVGFKNATDGSLQIAIDAMTRRADVRTVFWASTRTGSPSIIRTTGNPDGHVVLRGGRLQPNYDAGEHRATPTATLAKARPAAGADGRLQPRELRQAARAAGGSLAERHRATRGRQRAR